MRHDTSNGPRFFAALREIAHQPYFELPTSIVPRSFRTSAVLLVFFPLGDRVAVLMTRRAARLAAHSGEVCFPGGRLEPGESPVDAALREAREEVGLDPASVEVHGRLDDAWAFAGHRVIPIVASTTTPPGRFVTSEEVDSVLIETLDVLLDPERARVDIVAYRGVDYVNARLPIGAHDELYGLSADLLLEVRDRVGSGRSARGLARLDELRRTIEAGTWER